MSVSAVARRTQRQRSDATMSRVLDSAAVLFAERGLSAGLSDIATHAGVSKGALQYHFPSKSDLLIEVVTTGWNDLLRRLGSASPISGSTVRVRVDSLIDTTWESYRSTSFQAAYVITADPGLDQLTTERLRSFFETTRTELDTRWIDALAEFGASDTQIRRARRFARSHLLGMIIQRQLPFDEPAVDDELTYLKDVVARLAAPDAPRRPAEQSVNSHAHPVNARLLRRLRAGEDGSVTPEIGNAPAAQRERDR